MQSIVCTVSAVRAGSKCNLSFCQSLKSFQPTNHASFHMSGRAPTSMEKCFAADHESFRRGTVRRGAARRRKKKRKKGKNYERVKGTRRMARARSAAPIENHAARGVFFLFSLSLSLSLFLSFSFPLLFFSFFFYMRSAFARRAHCRFLHSKDFPLSFFLSFFFRTSLLKDRSMF